MVTLQYRDQTWEISKKFNNYFAKAKTVSLLFQE